MEKNEGHIYVKLNQLLPNPYQPPSRLNPPEEEVMKMAQSVLENGLFYSPIARPVEKDGKITGFQIFDGWQRRCWFAWLVAHGHKEYDEIPIELRNYTDEEMAEKAWKANEERKNYTVIDLAWSYRKFLADFKNITQAELAKRRGVTQGEIANTIRLLELPEAVQKMIISREITESHGRALLQLKDPKLMIDYAKDTLDHQWSVANLDGVIKTYLDKHKPKLVETPPPEPAKGIPCTGCPNNAACDRSKFTTDGHGGYHCEERDKALYLASREQPQEESKEPPDEETQEPAGEEVDEKPAEDKKPSTGKTTPQKSVKKEPPKKTPPAPVTTAPPVPTKPTWQRKLVLEETGNIVRVSVMADGKFPVMKGFNGSLEAVIKELPAFLIETNERWSKEAK